MWWIIIQDPRQSANWFSLKDDEREQFDHVLRHLPRIISTNKAIAEYFRTLRRLIEYPKDMLLEYQIRHQVLGLLLHLMDSTNSSIQSLDIYEYSLKLYERIEKEPTIRYSTSQLAAELNLSESYFYRLFRETIGQSPASYMERVRIGCASRLLLDSTLSITDITHELGYKTSQHFATVFKKHTGMTPRAWRRKHLNDRT